MPKYSLRVGGRKATLLETDEALSQRAGRFLNAEEPTTNVDEYGKSGGKGSYSFDGQELSHEDLRNIKKMRESGGIVAALVNAKALLMFGEGVDLHVGDNEETEQPVEGYEEPITLQEWLLDNFDDLDLQILELGKDATWYPYAIGETRKNRAGGFSDFLPAQPWTVLPETNRKGEIIAWHELTKSNGNRQERTLSADELTHLIINKNSARDQTGVSEVLRNKDEIQAYKENERAIENAIELHGFPQRHIKVGREEGAPVRDDELRRVRQIFSPSNTDANTAYFTGQDVDIESIEAEQFDYNGIHEMSMRKLTSAFMMPVEAGNVGSDGLGSGMPAELRKDLLTLSIESTQRMFSRQYVDKIMRPVIDEHSPFDPGADIQLNIGNPFESAEDMAELITKIGEHLTNDEIRQKLDMPKHEDDEIGESYRDPATIEAPEEESQDDGLFFSERELAEIPDKYVDGTGLSEDDFVPNESISDVIEPTLAFIDEHGLPNPDDQQEGAARINQLKRHIDNNEPLAPEFWREIRNFHKRHRAQNSHECDTESLPEKATEIDNSRFDKCHYDNGWFSDRTWGGDPAFEQAQRIVSALEENDVELSEPTPKHFSAGDTDFSNVRKSELERSEPWEASLLELHQRIWDADKNMKLLDIPTFSETPDFVRERIKDAIRSGAVFSDIAGVGGDDLFQVREFMTETLAESDGWTIDGLADQLEQVPGIENPETVARSETASVLNTARMDSYEDQFDEKQKFYWSGSLDSRTTEACRWLIRKTNPYEGGTPVTKERLKELIEEAPSHDPEMDDNMARPDDFLVHINERKTPVRAPPTE